LFFTHSVFALFHSWSILIFAFLGLLGLIVFFLFNRCGPVSLGERLLGFIFSSNQGSWRLIILDRSTQKTSLFFDSR
jgi:hypothetical protein